MIKVYLDVSMIMIGTTFTGIPRVVTELVKRLAKHDEFELSFIEYDVKNDAFRLLDTKAFAEFCETKTDKRDKIRTDEYKGFDEIEEGSIFFDCDTAWKTRARRSFLYPILKKNNVKIIPFIQDIIGIDYPQYCDKSDVLNFVDYIGSVYLYADKIIVNSNTTKHSLESCAKRLNIIPPHIKVILLGGDFAKSDIDSETKVQNSVKDVVAAGKYLLMVGTIEPRKNHKLLYETYDKYLRGKINLVLAGFRGWGMDEFFDTLESDNDYGKGVWNIGNATDADIDYLYKNCFAVTFPSYIEGYGLPLIEAFIREVPVIASDTEINKEVAGERAIYFEQDNAKELSDIILELLENEDKYDSLKEKVKGYVLRTWDETADDLAKELV